MNLQPTLQNDLVTLRPLAAADLDSLYRVASDPLIWEQHPIERWRRDVFEAFFEESLASQGALVVIDNATNEIIGSSRFKPLAGPPVAIEIGWSFLARAFWGGTYNKAFKDLMMGYALTLVDHIIFYIDPDNIRSQKAVEKIGGEQVTAAMYPHLMRPSGADLVYRVGR